ncbi:MAG: hypothetical protein EA398_12755 [Deltaproteobacteria bacterium]|nr:MAG: hypothetical protein EA398_12755 [Deltaproteobacteria bacterium]
MSDAPIPLGPFLVTHRLGAGGMGEVWHARHGGSGTPAAIKVILSEQAREARFREDFLREVRAAARLDHPHVIRLHDFGLIPPECAAASEGQLVAGSPFLAMEVASGSLEDLATPLSAATLLRVLRDVLSGVGHAHARGVIHRDLKPANVLMVEEGAHARFVLSDFGIAHASERHGADDGDEWLAATAEKPVGTPAYMAPEQLHGQWRDFGPWTDLYQIGIMAWELATGRRPFEGRSWLEIGVQHIEKPLPSLPRDASLPGPLDAWLARMCAKEPHLRFQRAADAASALDALARRLGIANPTAPVPLSSGPDAEGRTLPARRSSAPTLHLGATADTRPTPEADAALPPDCGAEGAPATASLLAGAGAGLFGLRCLPLVDREDIRATLDAAFEATRRDEGPQLVLLEGGPGTGKSRIAQWLTEQVHESGRGTPMRAVHQQGRGPSHGLPRMLANYCRALGLDTERLRQRIGTLLARHAVVDQWERDGLTALLGDASAPETNTTPSRSRPAEQREQHALIRRFLHRIATVRPVVLWLDDLHFGPDTMDFLEFVLQPTPGSPLRLLAVATVRTDELERLPLHDAQIRTLRALEATTSVTVGPLKPDDQGVLVDRLLGLDPELAREVCARSAGNPLFAVQLVGDWVAREVLEPTTTGFRVRDADRRDLPDDLHGLWNRRIEQILGPLGPGALHLFELAAALGLAIDLRELRAALVERQGVLHPAARDAMASAGLLHLHDQGWQFAHPLLRDSFERRSREAGRWADIQRACARALERAHAAGTPGVAARRAHHLLAAGQPRAAIPLLVEATEEAIGTVHLPLARDLLLHLDAGLDAVHAPKDDPDRGTALLLHADVHRLAGDFTGAGALIARVLDEPAASGWQPVRGRALVLMANVARQGGRTEEAIAHAREARTLFVAPDEEDGLARAELAEAIAHRVLGNTAEAATLYRSAMQRFARHRNRLSEAHCLLGLGHLARHRGALAEATRHYERAGRVFADENALLHQAHCINGLAEVARFEGHLDDAADGYRKALGILEALGVRSASILGINLAIVELLRGSAEEARVRFDALLAAIRGSGQHSLLPFVHAGLLACLASGDDEDAIRTQLALTGDQLDASQAVDRDLALLLEEAAHRLRERGRPALADGAAAHAARQRAALAPGRPR